MSSIPPPIWPGQRSSVSNVGLGQLPWTPLRIRPFGNLSDQQGNNGGLRSPRYAPTPLSRCPLPTMIRGGQVLRIRPVVWQPLGPSAAINPTLCRKMAKYTLDNSSTALKLLNFWMGTQSFIAAVFHGGYRIKGIPARGKVIPGLYEPSKYSGLLPGIYKPGGTVRKWLIDTPLVISCFWDGGNAFLKYASYFASPGTGLVAGAAELINDFAFNVCYSEPIMYRIMNKTTQFLRRFTKSIPAVDLMEKATPELARKGIPLSYRVIRTCVAGSMALIGIESIMKANSTWITPFLAKKLGPAIDFISSRYFPNMAMKTQSFSLKGTLTPYNVPLQAKPNSMPQLALPQKAV